MARSEVVAKIMKLVDILFFEAALVGLSGEIPASDSIC
jgi:hypothetical protein